MKYFKIAFLAGFGWKVGEAAYVVFYELVKEVCESTKRYIGGETNPLTECGKNNANGFTVRGFYAD